MVDREHLDEVTMVAINDPVAPHDELSNGRVRFLGNDPADEWELLEPIDCVEHSFHEQAGVVK